MFESRVELIAELDKRKDGEGKDELRKDVAERLRQEVEQMNVNNFIVRPKRKLVEKYTDAKAWEKLDVDKRNELVSDVAGLPSELVDDDQDAKTDCVANPSTGQQTRTYKYDGLVRQSAYEDYS